MTAASKSRIPEIIKSQEADLLKDWIKQQLSGKAVRSDLMKESELRDQCEQFLRLLREATGSGMVTDLTGNEWADLKSLLSEISASRARQGFSPARPPHLSFPLRSRSLIVSVKSTAKMPTVWRRMSGMRRPCWTTSGC
jgi:rsbT co-antagonist protein RsbR